jgi:hypothetical protein
MIDDDLEFSGLGVSHILLWLEGGINLMSKSKILLPSQFSKDQARENFELPARRSNLPLRIHIKCASSQRLSIQGAPAQSRK